MDIMFYLYLCQKKKSNFVDDKGFRSLDDEPV